MMSPATMQRLLRAQEFYALHGFRHRGVPWIVSPEADDHTRPFDKPALPVDGKSEHLRGRLIASGEQGFIQQILDGTLPAGLWQTCTPCFRDEPFDAWHVAYFTKLELIALPGYEKFTPFTLADLACSFFRPFSGPTTEVVRTGLTSYDVVADGIELGSYGSRIVAGRSFIYGTGLAEPRLSQVMAQRTAKAGL